MINTKSIINNFVNECLEENGVDTEDLVIADNGVRISVAESKRKNEFAGVSKIIILTSKRLERWLNCWVEYLRDAYKAASSDEKPLIATVGKLWRGVMNEVEGKYTAEIKAAELSAVNEYAGGEYEIDTTAETVTAQYDREFLIYATKKVFEGVVSKYPAVFGEIEENQLMPLNIATAMIQESARLNRWEKNFEVEEILKYTGGVIYEDKSGIEYLLSYDVLEMCRILDGTDGAIYDEEN